MYDIAIPLCSCSEQSDLSLLASNKLQNGFTNNQNRNRHGKTMYCSRWITTLAYIILMFYVFYVFYNAEYLEQRKLRAKLYYVEVIF